MELIQAYLEKRAKEEFQLTIYTIGSPLPRPEPRPAFVPEGFTQRKNGIIVPIEREEELEERKTRGLNRIGIYQLLRESKEETKARRKAQRWDSLQLVSSFTLIFASLLYGFLRIVCDLEILPFHLILLLPHGFCFYKKRKAVKEYTNITMKKLNAN
ncbi:hypothetical protein [Parageobacillus galactosidasius]|uniref:Uncharacterized protein n=1 Tax=Parageobacillus galactosidasius TaxID=883812 RepID=A0A226QSY3_9BACL|nr:hypothetical protein [Parageobacillus galactosidasius]OXB94700.1 hypothetical protein B9L23_07490 [Parageobacillus galactosidasius]